VLPPFEATSFSQLLKVVWELAAYCPLPKSYPYEYQAKFTPAKNTTLQFNVNLFPLIANRLALRTGWYKIKENKTKNKTENFILGYFLLTTRIGY